MMAKRPFAFGLPLPVGAVVLLVALGLAAPGWSAARDRFDRGEVSIVSVSNPHPDLVSGGQVLLRVTTPRRGSGSDVRITLNSVDVTSDFTRQADGSLLGLVAGLRDGPTWSARTPSAKAARRAW